MPKPTRARPSVAARTDDERNRLFDELAKLGPQPGMPAADIQPPIPYPPDFIAAYAAMASRQNTLWLDVPIARGDPRTPWKRNNVLRRVQRVEHGALYAFAVIEPYGGGIMKGWKVALLVPREGDEGTKHVLVSANAHRAIKFDCRAGPCKAAETMLQPTIDAGGKPPSCWAWDPPVELDTVWMPVGKPSCSAHEIYWNGRSGRWVIERYEELIIVRRNAKRICNAQDIPVEFEDMAAAKRFCETEDGR